MKLSTQKLKEMITTWLSQPEIRVELSHHSDFDPDRMMVDWTDDNKQITTMERARKLWAAPASVNTPEALEEFIWNLWCDGGNWKRAEKHTLKDEAEYTFTETEYVGEWKPGLPGNQQERRIVPSFPKDMLGESNPVLVEKYFNDLKLAEKCVYRLFEPDNQLADNYRLEVITTHDDTEVVGWWVTVD